ncbi:MAG: hypothetical protein HS111_32400 [Kofleriaceae bacterium]|nr:hypothetical protein [Kofleriaceae bacterium]
MKKAQNATTPQACQDRSTRLQGMPPAAALDRDAEQADGDQRMASSGHPAAIGATAPRRS